MFPCANPVASASNSSGGVEVMLSGTIAAVSTVRADVTKKDFNGAIPATESTQIDAIAVYQQIDVLGSNNISVGYP